MKYRPSAADIITSFRIIGTLTLAILQPFSAAFFSVYIFTGITDILDGWIARKTHTASDFGARLDSIADLLFYAVILLKIIPSLWSVLPKGIWYTAAVVLIIRISAYIVAAFKYRLFASLHTYLNKLTGMLVFFIPFLLITRYAVGYCLAVCIVAAVASLEELVIHLVKQNYNADTKSIFKKVTFKYDNSCF